MDILVSLQILYFMYDNDRSDGRLMRIWNVIRNLILLVILSSQCVDFTSFINIITEANAGTS